MSLLTVLTYRLDFVLAFALAVAAFVCGLLIIRRHGGSGFSLRVIGVMV